MILEHRQYRLYAWVAMALVAFGGAAFGIGYYYHLPIPDWLRAVILSGLLVGLLVAVRAVTQVARDNWIMAGSLAEPLAILESAGAGIFACDAAGVVKSVNGAGARLFGYSAQELLGEDFAGLLLADVTTGQGDFLRQHVASGCPGATGDVYQLTAQQRDGTCLPIRLSVNEFEITGVTGYVVVVYESGAWSDIRRVPRPAAVQMDGTAAAHVVFLSNQLRAPVTDVVNRLSLLRDAELLPPHRENVARASDTSMSLLQTIDHILDWHSMERDPPTLVSDAFNLRQLVHGVIGRFRSQALAKGIGLSCQYGDGLPPMLVGDAARLRQVMENLLDNAVKFTGHGEIKVTVDIDIDMKAQVSDSCQLRFIVQDSGIGIDTDDMPLLFTPYCHIAESVAGNAAGVGLGLALTHKLVSLMGGAIDVRAAPDQGAIFTVSMPLAAMLSTEPHRPSEVAGNGRLHIGVVCSNDQGAGNNVGACVTLIPDAMYFAEDSDIDILDIAQHLVTQGRLDLLVIYRRDADASMALAREVRACPPLASVAVLVLADQGDPGHSRAARDLGLVGFLTQPFDPGLIQRSINKAGAGVLAPLISRQRLDEGRAHELPRLLVAEDNLVNQKVVVALLEEMGVNVDVVANGEAAVTAAAANAYPLILMDCRMPGVDGYQATERIRQLAGGHQAIIIAMTASVMAGDRERCLLAGMDDYIEKPLEFRILKQKLSYWLQDKPVSLSSTGT